jgi:hypothetical protein
MRDEAWPEGERFIEDVKSALVFLSTYGFELEQAVPDPIPPRGEDVLIYQSPWVAIGIQRASWDGSVWGWFGRPNDEFAVLGAIGFWEVFEHLGLALPRHADAKSQIEALASGLASGCHALLSGDVSLLHAIWQARRDAGDALDAFQRSRALRIETHGESEILELPNTREILGEGFLKRYDDHDFSQERIWLVNCPMGEFYCATYQAARDCARDFGGGDDSKPELPG